MTWPESGRFAPNVKEPEDGHAFSVSYNLTRALNTLAARLDLDLVEHVLPAQRFGDALGLVLRQWVLRICAGDLEQPVVKHHHAERTKRDTRRNLDFIHVVDFEVARLFNPVFNERVSQGMFGLTFREEGPFND